MELRATRDILIGEDAAPSICPLACCLHRRFLSSRCSSCFCELFPVEDTSLVCPRTGGCPVKYCSVECYSLDIITHSASGDCNLLSMKIGAALLTDLRLACRLLLVSKDSFQLSNDRIAGLLARKQKKKEKEEDLESLHLARKKESNYDAEREKWKESIAFRAVVTNQAHVCADLDDDFLGSAVYPLAFSWINHSCSPNTMFRFEIFHDFLFTPFGEDPSIKSLWTRHYLCGVEGLNLRAPRLILRSIRHIKKGDEISVTYVNNRLPKKRRREQLLHVYDFLCKCSRCGIRELDAAHKEFGKSVKLELREIDEFVRETQSTCKGKIYMDCLCILIGRLLDPNSGLKLEKDSSLSKNKRRQLMKKIDRLRRLLKYKKLHPIHYVMRHLFSLYLSVCPASEDRKRKAAFSCVLTSSLHQIFLSEPSIIAHVAHSWCMFGIALENVYLELPPKDGVKRRRTNEGWCCGNCNDDYLCAGACRNLLNSTSPSNEDEFRRMCDGIFECIKVLMRDVWSYLSEGIDCLQSVRDPTDFVLCAGVEGPFTFGVSLKGEIHGKDAVIFSLMIHSFFFADFLGKLSIGPKSLTVHRVRKGLAAYGLL